MKTLRTLPEALETAARSGEGYTFVVNGADARRSYAELQHESFRVARSLKEAGLQRGDVVALLLLDAEHFLTVLFGASMAGVVPASVYPPATAGGLDRYFDLTAGILRASGARAVVTTAALASGFEALRPTCPDLALVLLREGLDAPARPPDALPSLHDIAFVQ